MTVSGLTMISAERQPDHNRDSKTHRQRSMPFPLWLLSSSEHGQLMAQCDDLGLHSSLATKPDEKGIEHHIYKVEHGPGRLAIRLKQVQHLQSRLGFLVWTVYKNLYAPILIRFASCNFES